MNECERYEAMISALIDGELSGEEEAELRAHMADCPDCGAMYEAYFAVAAALREQDVPDTLHEGIMTKVRAAEKAGRTQRTIVRLRPILAAAACLIVLVGTVFALKNTVGFGRRDAKAAPAEAPMAPEMNGVYSAGGSAANAPAAASASAAVEESQDTIRDRRGADLPTFGPAEANNSAVENVEEPPQSAEKTESTAARGEGQADAALQTITLRLEAVTEDGFIGIVTDSEAPTLTDAGPSITVRWDGDKEALEAGMLLLVTIDPQQQTEDGSIRAAAVAPAEE